MLVWRKFLDNMLFTPVSVMLVWRKFLVETLYLWIFLFYEFFSTSTSTYFGENTVSVCCQFLCKLSSWPYFINQICTDFFRHIQDISFRFASLYIFLGLRPRKIYSFANLQEISLYMSSKIDAYLLYINDLDMQIRPRSETAS